MIIVSDTTPLHYLILIDKVDLLRKFFSEIAVPKIVSDELQAAETPTKIKNFMSAPPSWLSVLPDSGLSDSELFDIDKGEREAILLAEKLMADGILVGDKAGRSAAEKRGLFVIGTLGILELAACNGDVDFRIEVANVKDAGFYVSDDLERFFIKRLGLD